MLIDIEKTHTEVFCARVCDLTETSQSDLYMTTNECLLTVMIWHSVDRMRRLHVSVSVDRA